jgi:hypothetical protein
MYQRAYMAISRKSTIHQTKRRLLIQNLKRVIRNFSGRSFVPAASSMYRPPSSATSQAGICDGEGVVRSSNPAWEFGEHLTMKSRKHRQRDQVQIEENDDRLAYCMEPDASHAPTTLRQAVPFPFPSRAAGFGQPPTEPQFLDNQFLANSFPHCTMTLPVIFG